MKAMISAEAGAQVAGPPAGTGYAVCFGDGSERVIGEGPPLFRVRVSDEAALRQLWETDAYTAATGFLRGEFEIEGDLVAAVGWHCARPRPTLPQRIYAALAKLDPARLESLFQSRSRAAANVRFHYDRSNEFFRQFLDSRMVYSCAYFKDPNWSIEEAQFAKLEHICRKLDLKPGERLLDVGCGWGGLLFHAAGRYGVHATGCTLSRKQFEYAGERARAFAGRVEIREIDYRDLSGQFDKIVSVGMFEHVGRRRMPGYFRKISSLLADDGLFLNHGITRPQPVTDDAQTLFLRRKVFPGGELPHLGDLIRDAENAGFEVLDVENLRPHYALTTRAWLKRLQENRAECLRLAGEETYRTWLLYLAGSAFNFEQKQTEVHQMLLAKRCGGRRRHLTREYMYRS